MGASRLSRLSLLYFALLAAIPSALAGQASDTWRNVPRNSVTGSDEIVITGSRPSEGEIREFIRDVTVETHDQIARFASPICPASLGFPAAHNEFIEARLRQIADHLALGTGAPGCRPNVVVIVAEQAELFLQRLRQDRPELFETLEPADIRRIMRLSGPSRAWHLVEPRGADGRPMERIAYLDTGPNEPPRFIANGRRLTGVMPSLTQRSTRQDLAFGFVVIDLDEADGLTLLQIADHAAMRILARTSIKGLPARRSILTLFRDRQWDTTPADALTSWDGAYLRALYRANPALSAHQQNSMVAQAMQQDLEGR